MRALFLAAVAIGASLLALGGPASAADRCGECGYFERPFTSARHWRGLPKFYYRAIHRRPTYYYVVGTGGDRVDVAPPAEHRRRVYRPAAAHSAPAGQPISASSYGR